MKEVLLALGVFVSYPFALKYVGFIICSLVLLILLLRFVKDVHGSPRYLSLSPARLLLTLSLLSILVCPYREE